MIQTLGRYRIVDELGRGAMSVIHRGFDPHINRMLAIKTLREEYARNEDYRRRFLSEARAAGTLTHPGIVTIFDVGESGDVPFIAMELLEGVTLDKVLTQKPAPSLRTLLKIAIQIAEALDYAHRNGVVHRDIKPENIICISESGDIKVADFGIAQIRADALAAPDAEARIAGTPQYMAPEMLGAGAVDGRSDLYSLGVVLYRMLSGRLPFSADTVPGLLAKVVGQAPPTLVSRFPDTPGALLDIVATLLAKDPGQRYQTAGELVEDLQQIDDLLAEHERAWAGRRIIPIRVRWTAFMSVLVAVTVVVGLLVVHQVQQRAARDLAFDYGFTLARMLSLQSAEDLLLEDLIAVQTMVGAVADNREIADISISDRRGMVLASSQAERIGTRYSVAPVENLLQQRGEQHVHAIERAGGAGILLFDTPIEYGERQIGRLQLGLTTDALIAANRATVAAMVALAGVTLVAVLVGAWFLSRRLMVPIELLRRSLWKIAQGRLDSRIRMHRQDEFERVFSAYNAMAESLESRLPSAPSLHSASSERELPDENSGPDSHSRTLDLDTDPLPRS